MAKCSPHTHSPGARSAVSGALKGTLPCPSALPVSHYPVSLTCPLTVPTSFRLRAPGGLACLSVHPTFSQYSPPHWSSHKRPTLVGPDSQYLPRSLAHPRPCCFLPEHFSLHTRPLRRPSPFQPALLSQGPDHSRYPGAAGLQRTGQGAWPRARQPAWSFPASCTRQGP